MKWFKRKPKPEPWDGNHELRGIKFVQDFGTNGMDYYSGWVWKCTCGTGTPGMPTRWPFTEAEAMGEFKGHKALHDA